jgi:hypothetical protein
VKSKSLLNGLSIFLALLTLIFSCTKIKSTDIGADLIPAVDNVNTFDTVLDVVVNNYLYPDSTFPRTILDASGSLPNMVLGHISNDPQFGQTTGSLFFELRPPTYKYSFGNVKDSLYLDSVVLCMKWQSTNGDTDLLQKIDVYQIDDQLKLDSFYRINSSFGYSGLLGSRTFAPSVLDDSVFAIGSSTSKVLRIRLNDEFGQSLLEQDSSVGQPYHDDSTFRSFFKGFAVVADQSVVGNALMGFLLSDTSTSLRIYYRFTKNGVLDTVYRSWSLNAGLGVAQANHIERDYTGSQIQNHLTVLPGGDSLVYIQTTPGSYANIDLSSLNGFKAVKGNVIIHRAELSMQQIYSPGEKDEIFPVPNFLYVDYFDSAQNRRAPFLTDGFANNEYQAALLGGARKFVLDSAGNIVADYRFTLSRHVQGIITRNEKNYPITLSAPFSTLYSIGSGTGASLIGFGLNALTYGRVKLGGTGNSHYKMRLRIIYSNI